MKKQKNMIIAGLILLIGAWVWYVWSGSEPEVVQQVEQAMDKQAEAIKKADQLIALERKLTSEEKGVLEKVLEKVVEASPKLSKMKIMQQAANREIAFYGQVLDQQGQPVIGAKVIYSVLAYEGIVSIAGTSRTSWKYTDSEGKFSVTGIKGEDITMSKIENAGYEFEFLNRTYYAYAQWEGHKPLSMGSAEKPVIFHAWKKTEAERLVVGDKFLWLEPDGRSYSIDLTKGNGSTVENGLVGDIKVSFKRPKDARRNEGFDWSVTIEAMGGGLIETTDTFMNEAPAGGYNGKWSISYKKGEAGYQPRINKKFYVKSRGGKHYSRLEVELIPYYRTHSAMGIKYWLNPRGSRNLQYDPSKRIRPR